VRQPVGCENRVWINFECGRVFAPAVAIFTQPRQRAVALDFIPEVKPHSLQVSGEAEMI